jgi:hypothetical protein
MLAYHWIKLLHNQFLSHGAFVLCGGVEVASAGTRDQFDLIAHVGFPCLYDLTASSHICEHGVDAFLVDDAHTFGRQAELDPTVFAFNKIAMNVKIRQKPTTGSVFGVRNIVSRHRALTRYLANT